MRGKKEENMAGKIRILVLLLLPLHLLMSSIVHEVPVEYIEYSIEPVEQLGKCPHFASPQVGEAEITRF